MATSPIYNWPEPDNTDLVKNGALAMRTLGDAIDTTMATMTPKSIVDAKGDLIAASAADTPARLAVGNNGETLVADSSTSTGLRYQGSMAAGRNAIINGGMDIWQRGTSIATAAGTNNYSADRWIAYRGEGGATVSRQVTGDTTNLPNIQYCARIQRNSGNTSLNPVWLVSPLESSNSIPFAGKTVVMSFYVRKGANYSATSDALAVNLYSGEGTDQNFVATYTGGLTLINQSVTLTSTWTRYSFSATVPTTATELALRFTNTPTGTAGANDYYEITGVQLELGSVPTNFSRAGGSIQGELAACQRYYWRNTGSTGNNAIASGISSSTSNTYAVMHHPVQMRVAPTAVDYASIAVTNTTSYTNGGAVVTLDMANALSSRLGVAVAGQTSNQPTQVLTETGGYVGLSAEL